MRCVGQMHVLGGRKDGAALAIASQQLSGRHERHLIVHGVGPLWCAYVCAPRGPADGLIEFPLGLLAAANLVEHAVFLESLVVALWAYWW